VSYRVLAVDDSLLMRRKVERALSNSEFEIVATAKDGLEAVERFKELSPDVVLLDVVMPKLDGRGALVQIMLENPQARVIMVSSLGTEETVSDCLDNGALRFIQKPFSAEVLLKTLRSVLPA
jgi:two-component system chemotaxis response regulator CheY